MFEPIDCADLYGDGIGKVELYPIKYVNSSLTARYESVATIASLSYGNEEAKNPQKLYQTLIDKGHLSAFEFVVNDPVLTSVSANGYQIFPNMRQYPNMPTGQNQNVDEYYSLFKIKVPIFVARQFVRHRNHSMLEMSRRYVKDSKRPFEFYQYDKDKDYYDFCVAKYQSEMAKGMLAQDARKYVPVGAYTEFWWMNNWHPLYSLKRLFELRLDKQHTQYETYVLCWNMHKLIEMHQPVLLERIANASDY